MKIPNDFNTRIFSHTTQGGRKYQEDAFTIAYQRKKTLHQRDNQSNGSCENDDRDECDNWIYENSINSEQNDLEYVFVGIFDGHGGKEAALYTRENLLPTIVAQREFWSNDDELILKAIKQVKWPKTASGLQSTAGTTASVCFIMNNKLYTGHVGDSKIVLGKKNKETGMWIPHSLTTDHKPESPEEKKRIYADGGEVIAKSGVERVVWYRPKYGHKGPIRRSTSFDRIPFLAVARSLGDLWSLNPDNQKYIVSPEPDVGVIEIDPEEDKCLLLASDGLWNVLLEHDCMRLVQEIEEPLDVERDLLNVLYYPRHCGDDPSILSNPSQALVSFALQRWLTGRMRADNTSVLTVLFEPRGPSKAKNTDELKDVNLSDEQLLQLSEPTILPQSTRPSEYLIGPGYFPQPTFDTPQHSDDDVNENIPLHLNGSFNGNRIYSFSNAVQNSKNNLNKLNSSTSVNMDNDKYSVLSPAMHSLCELAKRDVNYQMDNNNTKSNGEFSSHISNNNEEKSGNSNLNGSSSKKYINEMPDESFQALSDALKLRNNSTSPPMFKILSGIKVFYENNSRQNEDADSSTDVKYRDECVSVSEELVDADAGTGGLHPMNIKEISQIARVWSDLSRRSTSYVTEKHPPIKANEFNISSSSSSASTTTLSCIESSETINGHNHHQVERNLTIRRSLSTSSSPSPTLSRKRKLSDTSGSPPSKHLRSSRWSRGRLPVYLPKIKKRWYQWATTLMTTSRLRSRKQK